MIPIRNLLSIILMTASGFAIANPMKGIKEVGILIEDLDSSAKICNVTEDYLDAVTRLRLSNSPMKMVSMDKLPDAYIYVQLTVLDNTTDCIASLNISFNKYIRSERAVGNFWRRSELLFFRKSNFQNSVRNAIDNHITEFLGAWLKANPN
jgi:hypothetical protein